jgi:hypothetical protein
LHHYRDALKFSFSFSFLPKQTQTMKNYLLSFLLLFSLAFVSFAESTALPTDHFECFVDVGPDVPDVSISTDIRSCVAEATYEAIGVREVGGNNTGPEVDSYLATVGFEPGAPWCGAFVADRINQCVSLTSLDNYLSIQKWAYTPYTLEKAIEKDLLLWENNKYTLSKHRKPQSMDVFWTYNPRLGRVAHTGLVDVWHDHGNLVITIEGNTNNAGSREGDGVHVMYRDKRQLYAVADVLQALS